MKRSFAPHSTVIPAQAGTQTAIRSLDEGCLGAGLRRHDVGLVRAGGLSNGWKKHKS